MRREAPSSRAPAVPRARAPFALLVALLVLAPLALAHPDHGPGEAVLNDPLHAYRGVPWYTVVDDAFWVFGHAEKAYPSGKLPTKTYQEEWEFVADGDWLVWIDPSRPGGDVYAYNIPARAGIWLTEDDAQQHNPSIRGSMVAWEDYRSGHSDIYLYDLEHGSEAIRLTNDTTPQRRPVVGDGYVVYEDRRDPETGTDLWIHHLSDGQNEPLVVKRGDQTNAVVAGDYVLFRDDEFGQTDVMAVRVRGGGTPFYLTRDLEAEVALTSDGAVAYFLKSRFPSWRLLVFDGLRNRTIDTGLDFDQAPRIAVSDGIVSWISYHIGGRYYLNLLNLNTGKFERIADPIPAQGGPRFAGDRIVIMLQGRASLGIDEELLVIEPSRYATNQPPQLRMIGPPKSAPFTGPSFVANGTFRGNPVWGQPLRFEYRFGTVNWTAFDATAPEWRVQVEVPRGIPLGHEMQLEVRAVFADAPPVSDGALLEYVRVVNVNPLTREVPETPFWNKVQRAVGAIVLGVVALVLLVLLVVRLVLRGTLKRLFETKVEAEFVRDADLVGPPLPPGFVRAPQVVDDAPPGPRPLVKPSTRPPRRSGAR